MKPFPRQPVIESYSFGSILIDGRAYHCDVVIYPNRVESWRRKQGHLLQAVDVWPILSRNPDILVVGTGHSGVMRIAPDVEKMCRENGTELFAKTTVHAWKLYNELCTGGGRRVIAALHLTC
jgi:hypothetical protein